MKGMSTRETPLGWQVYRVHYSADPDKDPSTPTGKIWYEHARKGMKDRDWRKEHEIDYGALGGQLVFPEFDESIHYVPEFLPLDQRNWTVWLACDPHPRRAHSFVWLAVSRYHDLVVPWSWWPEELNEERAQNNESRLLISEYAEKTGEVSKSGLFPPVHQWLMDPAGKNFNADEERNFFDEYQAQGVIFTPAKKNREYAGYNLISEALVPRAYIVGDKEEKKPRLTIMRGCGHNDILVEQLKKLRFKEFRGAVTDKDPPADPMDKERHLVDCLSYILLDNPRFVDRTNRGGGWEPIYPAIGY